MCLSDQLSLVIVLTKYSQVVLEPIINVLYWCHQGFGIANPVFLACDGIHLNMLGQYNFFRSLRGTVLRFLRVIAPSVIILNLEDTCQFPVYLFTKPFSFVIVREFLFICSLANFHFSFKADTGSFGPCSSR